MNTSPATPEVPSPQTMRKMLRYIWTVLLSNMDHKSIPAYPSDLPNCSFPLFISWHLNHKNRGCIGNFEPGPLSKMIPEYTIISSSEDPRFPPVSRSDLVPGFECVLNLLTNFEPAGHWKNWQLGKHGVIVSFKADGRKFSATFLPEVTERIGDQEENIRLLVEKAGYHGDYRPLLESIHVERYQSSIQKMTYQEFLDGKL